MRRAVTKLGDYEAAELVGDAKECLATGNELSRRQDGTPRTLGGCYFKLVDQRIRQKDTEQGCGVGLNESVTKYDIRPYQEEIIGKVLQLFGRFENALAVQPTGTGKTFEAGEVIKRYSSGQGPVVFLQNTKVDLAHVRLSLTALHTGHGRTNTEPTYRAVSRARHYLWLLSWRVQVKA